MRHRHGAAAHLDRGHRRLFEREEQADGARLGQRREREHRGTRAGGEHAGRVAFAERGSILWQGARPQPRPSGRCRRRRARGACRVHVPGADRRSRGPRRRRHERAPAGSAAHAPPARVRRRHRSATSAAAAPLRAPASAPTTKVPRLCRDQRVEHRRCPTDLFRPRWSRREDPTRRRARRRCRPRAAAVRASRAPRGRTAASAPLNAARPAWTAIVTTSSSSPAMRAAALPHGGR